MTPAQLDRLHLRTRTLLQAALNTAPMDRGEVQAALEQAYRLAEVPMPPVLFVSSPQQAIDLLVAQGPKHKKRPAPTFDVQAALASQSDALRQVLAMSLSAQNPIWDKLGDEVDLRFNPENFSQLMASRALLCLSAQTPDWFPEDLAVLQFNHAVEEVLEARYVHQHDNWLLYSGGSASLWGAAGEFAQMELMIAAGELPEPTATYAAGRRLLSACGWLFALEKLCVICDRPAALSHPKLTPDGPRDAVVVTWRDGTVCRMHWEEEEEDDEFSEYDDDDEEGDDNPSPMSRL